MTRNSIYLKGFAVFSSGNDLIHVYFGLVERQLDILEERNGKAE